MNLRMRVVIISALISNIAAWECSKPGRFRAPEEEDDSCELYVTCIPNPDSTFEMRNDQCSSGSLFSAKYQRCIVGDACDSLEDFYSIEYECKECGKYVNIKSQDCRQFVNCLKTKDPGVYVPIKQNCPKEQVFSAKTLSCVDESEYQCPPIVLKFLSDFVCLDVGRYPDESVPNCHGYRLCSKLRNGTLVSKNFLCENNTIFSETERSCVPSDTYDCPDDGNNDFICPGVGRYPDKVSKTCETYHNCVLNSKGILRSSVSTCPRGTIFSAITSKCVSSSEYVCPTQLAEMELFAQNTGNELISIANAVASEEEVAVCTKSGRFANEDDELCETYYLCSRDPQGNWFKVIVRCPPGSLFSSERKRCVGSEEFTCPVATTEPSPTTTTDISRIECVGAGRVPNTEDVTCRTYFLCSLNSDNALIRAQFSCPQDSVFSAQLNKCVKGDGIPHCSKTTITTLPDNSDESGDGLDTTTNVQVISETTHTFGGTSVSESLALSSNSEPINSTTTQATTYEYPCTATGRFADINSVNCRSYFLCTDDKSGGIVSVHLNCPSGMVFSRNENKCVVSTKYLC
ncbi:uncharacterized protein LOC131676430 [Topomyia yanbarensis]|uniref:uncharacterized protein LOC131676430 n=1 Tax=Topomyia yanbarensis TaxID=2498891 RepID=UPI00273C923D|nr:uncharacterized protein LOC131676430 [Topomyia yanbarensis]